MEINRVIEGKKVYAVHTAGWSDTVIVQTEKRNHYSHIEKWTLKTAVVPFPTLNTILRESRKKSILLIIIIIYIYINFFSFLVVF